MLVIGLGGAFIQITSQTSIYGMSLAAIVGIILNQILSLLEKIKKLIKKKTML